MGSKRDSFKVTAPIPRKYAKPRSVGTPPISVSLLKISNMLLGKRRMRRPNGYSNRWGISSSSQRCIVKYSFSKSSRTINNAHLSYISRASASINSDSPVLDFNLNTDSYIYKNQYRFIISPENNSADLYLLSRHAINVIKSSTSNNDLQYVSCVHYDTDHPHIHIIVAPYTRSGEFVKFNSAFLKTDLRLSLCNHLTDMLGPRDPSLYKGARSHHFDRPRFTVLDKHISAYIINNIFHNSAFDLLPARLRNEISGRLAFLGSQGLCDRSNIGYIFNPEWKYILKSMSSSESLIEATRHVPDGCSLVYYNSHIGSVSGEVLWLGRRDELSDMGSSILIRARDNTCYYASIDTDSIVPSVNIGSMVEFASSTRTLKEDITDSRSRFSSDIASPVKNNALAISSRFDIDSTTSREEIPNSQGPVISNPVTTNTPSQNVQDSHLFSSAFKRKKSSTIVKLLPDIDLHSR